MIQISYKIQKQSMLKRQYVNDFYISRSESEFYNYRPENHLNSYLGSFVV